MDMISTRARAGRRMRWVALLAACTVAIAACGGGDDGNGGSSSGGGNGDASDLPSCPLDALEEAGKPVEITMWHAMTRANEEELTRLTNEFNASQQDVKVTLSAAPSYQDNLTRYRAGLSTGELPDLMQGEDTSLQYMIDSASVLPAQSCIEADDYDTSDTLPRVLNYYTVQDVLWPMPFNVSNPVLYYNKAAFQRAGLDPETPPKTLDEVRAASQQIVDSGANPYGIAFKTDAWFFEHWMAKAAEIYVDNENGRAERATSVAFDNETGVELWTWLDDMVDDGLMLSTGDADIDHLLAIGNEQAAMTIDTSAALGTISQILGSGQFAGVTLGVGPMAGPDSPDGGVLVGGAALYIVNQSAPEKQAAAFEFAKYLNDPQVQAEWAAATGYIPIRESSVTMSPLVERWTEQPYYRIAYDQLLTGPENPATAGPVIGPYGARGEGVRGAVIDGLQSMLAEGTSPEDAIRQAAEASNTAIEEYNARF
jgi:sn-glycerol 3-phosphate transport system substrate-binding protein